MDKITVLVADDHPVVLAGVRHLLAEERDIAVVGEALNGKEAIALAVKLEPSVVLLDITMPEMNGLNAARELKKRLPGTNIVILSVSGDEEYVVRAVDLGVDGYVLKDALGRELVTAIRKVHGGTIWYSPSVTDILVRLGKRKKTPAHGLTLRELDVLQGISDGKTNKHIAGELSISVKTVEKHRASLMEKANVHDAPTLIRWALSKGLIK